MSDVIQIPREVLESRDNFVVRGDLEIDIVTAADHVATLIGSYAILAIRIKNAERSYIGCVPWHSEFHEDFTEVFDAGEAVQRPVGPGTGEVRGCRVLIPLRALTFTEEYGLSAETAIQGLKVSAPMRIDAGLPDQRMTLTLSRCITHPTIQRIGQLVELSRSINRPNRFGQRLKRELQHVKTTFGEPAWLEVLGKIQAEYNAPIAQHRLFQPRDDGFAERQRFRDLAKIEAAALAYVSEVSRDLAAQLVRRQRVAEQQAQAAKGKSDTPQVDAAVAARRTARLRDRMLARS